MSVAFLLLSAVGLSASTKLVPAEYHDSANEPPFFLFVGGAAVVVGLLVLSAARPIRSLMSGVH